MSDPVYVGVVCKHPAYVKLESDFPEISTYTQAFKEYWANGFHPMIGKDGILPVPQVYALNAIGRVHLEPPVKKDYPASATEKAWKDWRCSMDVALLPTSNKFLMYCVDDQRDACLLGYLDGDEKDSHEVIKSWSFRNSIKAMSDEFYKYRGSAPMPISEHDLLFSEKWEF